jgi:hypothetical protein
MGFTDKIKKAYSDYQADKAQKQADEEERQTKILAGNIAPISILVNLESGETAYLELPANRMATVERIEEHTVGKTKKKGVVTRAVVGGVLLGPLGALGGAATAGSKGNSKTIQKSVSRVERVDTGKLIFTNKRVMFLGNNVFSLPYQNIVAAEFSGGYGGNKLALKYQDMLNGEHFIVSGPNAKDSELYYKGITTNLVGQVSKQPKRLN